MDTTHPQPYDSDMSSGAHKLGDRRPTYADIVALPPNVVGEIIAGQLVVSPRPAIPHANAYAELLSVLRGPFHHGIGGPGGWWILAEPELSLDVDPNFDPIVPDLAGWRRELLPTLPSTAQMHVAPQWVCEILSPSTRRRDRVLKLPFYQRAGVDHLWLVDPDDLSLEVFHLAEDAVTRVGGWGGDALVKAAPFDAIDLNLALLWDLGGEPEAELPAAVDE